MCCGVLCALCCVVTVVCALLANITIIQSILQSNIKYLALVRGIRYVRVIGLMRHYVTTMAEMAGLGEDGGVCKRQLRMIA